MFGWLPDLLWLGQLDFRFLLELVESDLVEGLSGNFRRVVDPDGADARHGHVVLEATRFVNLQTCE